MDNRAWSQQDGPSGDSKVQSLEQAVNRTLDNKQKLREIEWLEPSTFARITAECPGGQCRKYFLKCASGDAGRTMLEGEYCSMSEIYKATPSLVPHPYGCGQFRHGNDDLSFLLSDFIDMDTRLPDPEKLSECITTLQRQSHSPTGEFGFFTTTCHGKIPQQVSWDSSWTSFYAKLLQGALQQDLDHNGPWPRYEKVASRTVQKVVPRLLGALEADGRSVEPVLTHGDLWEGNIATEKGTGKTLLIDAAAYYAHHEMEIGMWRCQRHAIHDPKFRDAYLDRMPKDEPKDEWDDRNRLYCVKMNVIHSAHHDHVEERKTAFEDMCFLVDKYAPFSPNALEREGLKEWLPQAVEEAKSH
ncbi:MAG: hypothetical protein Q9212_004562 [Teloschistes hypoglaucus]